MHVHRGPCPIPRFLTTDRCNVSIRFLSPQPIAPNVSPKVSDGKAEAGAEIGSDIVIEVTDLFKRYDDVKAVDHISFKIRKGEVFAFLGPNGAGKTTCVEMIETIRDPTSGTVRFFGLDIGKAADEIKPRIGVLPQQFSSFDKLTVKETVSFYGNLYDRQVDFDDLLKQVGLTPHAKMLYQYLSGGLKQRVGIAVALSNDPEVVFLDEPTTGLDPGGRREVWALIKKLRKMGKTVFLTTHYMEEAEVLADHIAIIHHGKIIAEGTVDELITAHGGGLMVTFKGVGAGFRDMLKGTGHSCEKGKNGCVVTPVSGKEELLELLRKLQDAGTEFKEFDVRRSNLEEVFLKLTGEVLGAENGNGQDGGERSKGKGKAGKNGKTGKTSKKEGGEVAEE